MDLICFGTSIGGAYASSFSACSSSVALHHIVGKTGVSILQHVTSTALSFVSRLLFNTDASTECSPCEYGAVLHKRLSPKQLPPQTWVLTLATDGQDAADLILQARLYQLCCDFLLALLIPAAFVVCSMNQATLTLRMMYFRMPARCAVRPRETCIYRSAGHVPRSACETGETYFSIFLGHLAPKKAHVVRCVGVSKGPVSTARHNQQVAPGSLHTLCLLNHLIICPLTPVIRRWTSFGSQLRPFVVIISLIVRHRQFLLASRQ